MLQVGHWDIEKVLELLRYPEVFNNTLSLFTEMSVDFQCFLGIDVRHLEIMLYENELIRELEVNPLAYPIH